MIGIQLLEFMKFLEIDILLTRCQKGFDETKDWNETLAMGEKQMLAMARCYYHCPKYAILDECSSAVSVDLEAKMYEKAVLFLYLMKQRFIGPLKIHTVQKDKQSGPGTLR